MMQTSARAGFLKAYQTVQIDPQKYLAEMKRAHRLPIHTWSDMFHVEESIVHGYANQIIKSSMRTAGLEGAEKWAGRLVPVISAGFAATLNYYFVRAWGRRAQKHFAERHRQVRAHGLPQSRILNLPVTGTPRLRSAN